MNRCGVVTCLVQVEVNYKLDHIILYLQKSTLLDNYSVVFGLLVPILIILFAEPNMIISSCLNDFIQTSVDLDCGKG